VTEELSTSTAATDQLVESDTVDAVDAGSLAPEQDLPLIGAALRGSLEAILLVVDEPVEAAMLAQILRVPTDQVTVELTAIARQLDDEERGFELRRVGQGWRYYTRAAYADAVERFVLDGQHARLTQAALETLAVVAYRQPVSRSRVSAVRGVNVDGVIRTLVARGLIEDAGTEHESGATLYRTTPYFLERLGITHTQELPDLANFLPMPSTIDGLEAELSGRGLDDN
jgi:segregation and condensation protein B